MHAATATNAPPTNAVRENPFAAPTMLPANSRGEESDCYGEIVALLNPKLRVIRGKCGLQWIVQAKNRPTRWTSFAYCGTKEGLLLRLPKGGQGCDPAAWKIIEALPDYFRAGSPVSAELRPEGDPAPATHH